MSGMIRVPVKQELAHSNDKRWLRSGDNRDALPRMTKLGHHKATLNSCSCSSSYVHVLLPSYLYRWCSQVGKVRVHSLNYVHFLKNSTLSTDFATSVAGGPVAIIGSCSALCQVVSVTQQLLSVYHRNLHRSELPAGVVHTFHPTLGWQKQADR